MAYDYTDLQNVWNSFCAAHGIPSATQLADWNTAVAAGNASALQFTNAEIPTGPALPPAMAALFATIAEYDAKIAAGESLIQQMEEAGNSQFVVDIYKALLPMWNTYVTNEMTGINAAIQDAVVTAAEGTILVAALTAAAAAVGKAYYHFWPMLKGIFNSFSKPPTGTQLQQFASMNGEVQSCLSDACSQQDDCKEVVTTVLGDFYVLEGYNSDAATDATLAGDQTAAAAAAANTAAADAPSTDTETIADDDAAASADNTATSDLDTASTDDAEGDTSDAEDQEAAADNEADDGVDDTKFAEEEE